MKQIVAVVAAVLCGWGVGLFAQEGRPASPSGSAAVEVRGRFVNGPEGPVYKDGKWIEISFGRPIKRGRDLFGSGAAYGKSLNSGAPVWRAGANVTTRLKTEAPLVIGGRTVAPGEYTRLHRSEAECLDAHRVELARAAAVRREEYEGVVGRLRLHARQGCRSRPDEDREVAALRRTAGVGVRRRVRCGWNADGPVGHDNGVGAVHDRSVRA